MHSYRQGLVLLALLALKPSLPGGTFLVINTNNAGPGSLRQAILDSNAQPGKDSIHFALAGTGRTISVSSNLPPLMDPVDIDATTQPGFSSTPLVELNGQSAGPGATGLQLRAGSSLIRGLVINRFTSDGLIISSPGSNVVEGCFIGVDPAGTSGRGNTLNGINITNSPGNRIGGNTVIRRNLISGNRQNGVLIQGNLSQGNVLQGNNLGLNLQGATAIANSANGVFLNHASSNSIGGTVEEEGNTVSGNGQSGVRIEGTNAFSNRLLGNRIGTDVSGLLDRGNSQHGVYLLNAPRNEIGGSLAGARNIISGNGQTGVRIEGAPSRNNLVLGNDIGLGVDGVTSVGNSLEGILVLSSSVSNRLGGIEAGQGNRIAYNGSDGIWIQGGTNNVMRGNSLHSNGALGIDIGPDGKAANDVGDLDVGANQLQNYPLLLNASNSASGLLLEGQLNSRPATVYILDFYSNPQCDPSTNGEAFHYLGSLTNTTAGDGSLGFSVLLPTPQGRHITATATDPVGNTSELCPCISARSGLPPSTLTVTHTNDNGPGSLREIILQNNLLVSAGPNVIRFNIPGDGVALIQPQSQLPFLVEPAIIDGFTQPGAQPNTLPAADNSVIKVRIDGALAGNGVDGFRLAFPGMTLRGLSITRFSSDGIEIVTNGTQVIEGCYIGVEPDGITAGRNTAHGVHINGVAGNRIGGLEPAQRNLISANGQHGVLITGAAAQSNLLQGNLIGSDRNGTGDLGNGSDGVQINNAPNNSVGGSIAGAANLISGNNIDGIRLSGAGATNTLVRGNFIGLTFTSSSLPNNLNGVRITANARFNLVGGTGTGDGNQIGGNGNTGVIVSSGTNNAILGNSIYENGALGIDLELEGISSNDPEDSDTGANLLQNHPLLDAATLHPGRTTVSGSLNSRPLASYRIEFFASPACDSSGAGEGRQFLGFKLVSTDSSGDVQFDADLATQATGRYLTATATDAGGNSSEFSPCFRADSTLASSQIKVTSTADTGPGSLRQALLDVASSLGGGATLVQFDIPGSGVHTITPLSPLPVPSEPVFVDGYSQPGATPNTASNGFNASIRIRLNFSNMGGFGAEGFRIRAGGSTLRGLAILQVLGGEGIDLGERGGNTIVGCLIGMDLDGTERSVRSSGIVISSANNRIGGPAPAERNVIGFSWGPGLMIQGEAASNNVVAGNFIGTDFTGRQKRGNFSAGISIQSAAFNRIGGSQPGEGNLIAGNQAGISIASGAHGNVIAGNRIGTDVTGTERVANSSGGIGLTGDAHSNLVGGAQPGAGNIISGNDGGGLDMFNSSGNRVLGNLIGVSATGLSLSNKSIGIAISGSSESNQIGGAVAGEGNWIAFNGDSGVMVSFGSGNAIRANRIHDNHERWLFRASLGIDLGEDGVTPNDMNDEDAGANSLQNHPIIESASSTGTSSTVKGRLESVPSRVYQLDFFANTFCDPSGYGEGQFYLGTRTVSTDATGLARFDFTLPVGAGGRYFTATATSPGGDTSEFSPCTEGQILTPPATFQVTSTADSGPGSLRDAIHRSNNHLSSQKNTIQFNIPGSGIRTIFPASPLPRFSQPVVINGRPGGGALQDTVFGPFGSDPLIELNGRDAAAQQSGLVMNFPGLEVRGLRVIGFPGSGLVCQSANATIQNNFISGNRNSGIQILNSQGNLIGGDHAGQGNLISGNDGTYGIEIEGENSSANVIRGNFIGVGVDGLSPFGRQFAGISIVGGRDTLIGGLLPGQGNVIAHHDAGAIRIQSGEGNVIRGNSFFDNGGIGLDLGQPGQNFNDPGDMDEGANGLQNHPVLSDVHAMAGATRFVGTLNSTPSTSFEIDFFANRTCGFNGIGEGRRFLGRTSVFTDLTGDAMFDVTLPITIPLRFLSATATGPAGTSEGSECIEPSLITIPGSVYLVTTTADSGPGSLRQAIQDAHDQPNIGREHIHFRVDGPGVGMFRLETELPDILEPMDINGFTQTLAGGGNPADSLDKSVRIQLDGERLSSGGDGLRILTTDVVVQGLSITRFPGSGIFLGSPNDGSEPLVGNSTISGNLIGIPPQPVDGIGLADWGNQRAGLVVRSPNNLIGNSTFGAGNVISGNQDGGIVIAGADAQGTILRGNLIGTDSLGISAVGNRKQGIGVFNTPNLIISQNTIGGSGSHGIEIWNEGPGLLTIQGNHIGTDTLLERDLGNGGHGIFIQSANGVLVGGSGVGQGNSIAFNDGAGVNVSVGSRNTILRNSIFDNTDGPIRRGFNANDQVNPPTLGFSTLSGNDLTVRGNIQAPPNTTVIVDVFVTPQNRDGLFSSLGSFPLSVGPSGTMDFNQIFPLSPPLANPGPGSRVNATLTLQNGSTSAGSGSSKIVEPGTVDLEVDKFAEPPVIEAGSSGGFILRIKNRGPATATNVRLTDTLPAGLDHISSTVPSDGSVTDVQPSGGLVDYVIPTLPPGKTIEIAMGLTPGEPGVYTNRLSAIAAQKDNDPSNNSSVAQLLIRGPNPGLASQTASTAANTTQARSVNDPISTYSGELYDLLPPDLAFGGGPLQFGFQRYYASRIHREGRLMGVLGENWLHNFEASLSNRTTSVEITLFPGMTLTFTNDAGSYRLINRPDARQQLKTEGNQLVLSDPGTRRSYRFNSQGLLIRIGDLSGNAQILEYSGAQLVRVTDGSSRRLEFKYNSQGQLTNVTDGVRQISFGLSGGKLQTFTNPQGVLTTYAYTDIGSHRALLTSVTRPAGNRPLTQTYNQAGQVSSQTAQGSLFSTALSYIGKRTEVRDPAFNTTADTYDSAGRLLSITDPAGQSIRFEYDATGRISKLQDRLGHATLSSYHPASGRLLAVTNPNGAVTRFQFQPRTVEGATHYEMTQTTDADGSIQRFEYDTAGRLVRRTDRLGHVLSMGYTPRGQLESVTNPAGGVVRYTYNADGTRASVQDSDRGVTRFEYDALGRMTNLLHPDGASVRLRYDVLDRLVAITDERDQTHSFDYDANGNLIRSMSPLMLTNSTGYDQLDRSTSARNPSGAQHTLNYDPVGNIANVRDPNGLFTFFEYDSNNQLSRVQTTGGEALNLTRDAEGRWIGLTNSLGFGMSRKLDAMGNEVERRTEVGGVIKRSWDLRQRLVSHTDSLNRTVTYTRDLEGRLTAISHPGVGITRLTRNSLGGLESLTGLNGETWRRTHTKMGRLQESIDPLNRTNRYSFDNRGRISRIRFPDGTTQTNTADPAGNITRRTYSDGTSIAIAFDSGNRPVSINDVSLSYDSSSRITNTVRGGVGYRATYDSGGRMITASYHNGAMVVTYSYGIRDRLTRVRDNLTGTQLDFTYDNAGRLITIQRPNSVNTTYNYDGADQVTRIRDGNVIDLRYQLDTVGQVTRTDYTVPLDPAPFQPVESSSWTYDLGHQISSPGYHYDARGRLLASPGNTYTWDGASRLIQANAVRFEYNGLGQLVRRMEGGSTRNYHYNQAIARSPIMAESSADGSVMRYYVWSPQGRLLYLIDATQGHQVRFFHFDRTGSTLALTDVSGAVTDTYAYSPFGQLLGRTGVHPQPFQFIGAYGVRADAAVGLYQMRHRYYDPRSARFLSRDPIWPVLHHGSGLNPYQYAFQDPMRYMDPEGLDVEFMREKHLGTPTGKQWNGLNLFVLSEEEMLYELDRMRQLFQHVGESDRYKYDQGLIGDSARWIGAVNPFVVSQWDSHFFHRKTDAFKFRGRIYNYGELNQYFFGQWGRDAGLPPQVIELGLYIWKIPMYTAANIKNGKWELGLPSMSDVNAVYNGWTDAAQQDLGLNPMGTVSQGVSDELAISPRVVKAVVTTVMEYAPEIIQVNQAFSEAQQCVGDLFDSGVSILSGIGDTIFGGSGQ